MSETKESLWHLLGYLFKAHPWHGIPIGDDFPELVNAYIEVVPGDTIKYELDKSTGHLKVDRPQAYSNVCPTMYGFIPQTWCDEEIAQLCAERTGRKEIVADQDPLDVCVISEKVVSHGDILLEARPIGGLRMIDGGEADDKIIAVMKGDAAFNRWRDIDDCPNRMIDRLRHYFLTYKQAPQSDEGTKTEITHVYGREEAYEVIRRAHNDYIKRFSRLESLLEDSLAGSAG
ncbi:MAG: inorganic pyrophosphatase [Gammaproteobacteria bacterium]|nr:inorganic pyrophosphatase [Gammaproteobacteria bacterium]MCZ6826032.1 inorganic pyrophosphatase [Gammaproteobacteria bacterium]MCZ6911527.1 inorganic pyrophosphatase [Pseudomonadota bacterium]